MVDTQKTLGVYGKGTSKTNQVNPMNKPLKFGQKRTHFSKSLWNQWLKRLQDGEDHPHSQHLSTGIGQFRQRLAQREPTEHLPIYYSK